MKMYLKLRGNFQKVEWRKLVCNNVVPPKWTFILYLALNERLQTRERLASWRVVDDTLDVYYADPEKIMKWMHIDRHALCWKEEVIWALQNFKGRKATAKKFRMALVASVYVVWHEKNLRIFQNITRSADTIIRSIIPDVHIRGSAKLISTLNNLDYYL